MAIAKFNREYKATLNNWTWRDSDQDGFTPLLSELCDLTTKIAAEKINIVFSEDGAEVRVYADLNEETKDIEIDIDVCMDDDDTFCSQKFYLKEIFRDSLELHEEEDLLVMRNKLIEIIAMIDDWITSS